MKHHPKKLGAMLAALVLIVAACGSSEKDGDQAAGDSSTTAADSSGDSDTTDTTETTETTGTTGTTDAEEPTDDPMSLFADGALTSEPTTVDCTLENGSDTTCYQVEVASLASTVNTDGPFCPETTAAEGGIWVWDGDNPGLHALDTSFWDMVSEQGFEFSDAAGNISIVDPAGGGPSDAGTENSCLQATADGSFHLQVLIPVTPEDLDEPTDLSTVAQTGLALDGVTIFGDAPSVQDTGGLPALDACGGHVDPSGYYHWHFGAESIQTNLDEAGADVTCSVEQDPEALVAFAFDGYGIYGPEEGRDIPSDLDECSGHVSDTAEFGERYHYHLTYDSPNLPACRVGATAQSKLTSPDNDQAALPDGGGAGGGGGPGGPPGDGGPPGAPGA